jgi:hypothetical protein
MECTLRFDDTPRLAVRGEGARRQVLQGPRQGTGRLGAERGAGLAVVEEVLPGQALGRSADDRVMSFQEKALVREG